MNMVSKKNAKLISGILASVLLSCAGPCFAQNVADAARQERERKEHTAHRANHVYTNEDLKRAQILLPEDRERALEARRNAASPTYDANNPNAPGGVIGATPGKPATPGALQIPLLPFSLPQAQAFGEFAPAMSAPYFESRHFGAPVAPRVRRAHPLLDDELIIELQKNQSLPPAPDFPSSSATPVHSAARATAPAAPGIYAAPDAISTLAPIASPARVATVAPPVSAAAATPVHEATHTAPATAPVIASNPVAPPSYVAPAPVLAVPAPKSVIGTPAHAAPTSPSTAVIAPHATVPADRTAPLHSAAASTHAQPHFVASAIAENIIRVQRGDSLWKLAQEHLGNGARWPEIASVNPEIVDPNIIQIGEMIRLAPQEPLNARRFIVQPGDTLSGVALSQFGNARAFTCIASANPNLRSADLIFAGQSLILPDNCPIVR